MKIFKKIPKKFFWDDPILGFGFCFWGRVGLYLGKKTLSLGEIGFCLWGN